MKTIFATLMILLLMFPLFLYADTNTELSPEEAKYFEWAKGIWDSLDRRSGEIRLDQCSTTLSVPENFYYLNPEDSEKILTEVWKNPPGQKTLGMIFPAEMTPFDQNAWGVTIGYDEDGYVSDKEAGKIDYNELLSQMKKDMKSANKERVSQGYEPIELVGWASQPYYDSASHKLHWAKEIKFGDQSINTLNYNIRVLGRKGVLVLNFIAGIDQKEMIESELDSVLAIAEFDSGARYTDFDPKIDNVAAYGIGALIAGKLIAKTGLLTGAFLLFKKFGIFLIIGIGALMKKLFKRREEA